MFYLIILPALTAFVIVLLSTPSFIRVATLKHLFDTPNDERKLHSRNIPLMGGVMIFAGTIFSFLMWFPSEFIGFFKYFLPALLILFFVGIKDDIIGTAPVKKLLAQIIVAFIMVFMAHIRIKSMYGIFGIYELPDWFSYSLSLFTFIVIINAYNLIDGVDGLAGSIGFLASLTLGVWFYLSKDYPPAVFAFSLAGALLAFLRFNFHPAQIFMGDTGSLTIGLMLATLTLIMIQKDISQIPDFMIPISKPLLGMAVLAYPLTDTLRIFAYRAYKGLPPFQADNNHIHHRLLKLGLNQVQTVLTIVGFNLLIILLIIFLSGKIETTWLFLSIFVLIITAITLLFIKKTPTNN